MTDVRIAELRVRTLRIPFKTSFRHASAERSETATIWVEAISTDGAIGYGESCPRPYVTAETIDTATMFVVAHRDELRRGVTDVDSLRRWLDAHAAAVDANPAAWCAIELAMLDVFAKSIGRSVDALLGLEPLHGPFQFSAVVGDASPETFAALVAQYRHRGFVDFKIKLAGDLPTDRAKIDVLRDIPVRVRADANNLWPAADDAIGFLRSLAYPLFALEEPIRANQYEALGWIADALGCRIVLDESLLRADQFADLPGPPTRWIVNLRVSKMGGLLRSLDVVRRARLAGVGVIVGAQVGETSLLTRVALSVATAAGPGLVAQEGAFGTYLLQFDVCDPPLMFGEAGVLNPLGLAEAPGFGLPISPTAVDRAT